MTLPRSPSGDAEALAEEAVEVAGTLVDLIEAANISDEVHLHSKALYHPIQKLGSHTASAKRALSCIIIRSTFDRMCTCLSCSCALYMVVKRTYVIEARL